MRIAVFAKADAGRDRDAAELAAVQALRERLGSLWATAEDEEAVVGQVNALLSDTRANPWLTRHSEMPEWHLHLAADQDPLAQRMGEKAMETKQIVELQPMTPHDRRIVHMAVSEMFPGLTTRSEGEGEDRHICLIPATSAPAPAAE